MVELKEHIEKEVVGATNNPQSEVRIANSIDTRSQVPGMTGTATNNKFISSMNRRKSRFGDRAQRGDIRGYFNKRGPGRGNGYDKKKDKKNEEGKDSFTEICEDLKNCVDGK